MEMICSGYLSRQLSLRALWQRLTVFALTMFLFSPLAVRAELAARIEMSNVAANWLHTVASSTTDWANETSPSLSGEQVEMRHPDGVLMAICYNVSPSGFIIVPTLKGLSPVRFCSDKGRAVPSDKPGSPWQIIMTQLASDFDAYRAEFGNLDAAPDTLLGPTSAASAWEGLSAPSKRFGANVALAGVDEAGPLLATSWAQGYPYNTGFPLSGGVTTEVGCVNLAAAQIMNYHQWPPHGTGTHEHYWSGDWSCNPENPQPGGDVFADLTDTYDWPNMADSCDLGCTPQQIDAISELCFEISAASCTQYGACNSNAWHTGGVIVAYTDQFAYKSSVSDVFRPDYTVQEWYNLAKGEIDAGRPIQYGQAGHSLMCDGYRQIGSLYQLHLNYGWAGDYNGWYTIDNLFCWGCDGNLSPPSREDMIIGIEPQTTPILAVGGYIVDDAAGDNDGVAEPGETVALSIRLSNCGWDATGIRATLSCSDPYVTVASSATTSSSDIGYGGENRADVPISIAIAPDCPDPGSINFDLLVEADGGYTDVVTFSLFVSTADGFYDDCESGQQGWTHENQTVGYVDSWHLESADFHSGTTAWKSGGSGNGTYSSYTDAYLISAPIRLPDGATLEFWHRVDLRYSSNEWVGSGGVVYISPIETSEWSAIEPEGGYDYLSHLHLTSLYDHATPCFASSQGWEQASFDLADYSGIVQFMFRLSTDANEEDLGEGWYIDDIGVLGCCSERVGDANGLAGDEPTVGDVSVLIDAKFITGACNGTITCLTESDINQSGGSNPTCDDVTIGDISILIDYLFITGSSLGLPDCLQTANGQSDPAAYPPTD